MQIKSIKSNDSLWYTLIQYTNSCEREAWPVLSKKLMENNFGGRERVFVATKNSEIIWFCTFTQEDWIHDCTYYPFVWFIFVDENYRWKRISEKMIDAVEEYAKTLNFKKLYIVSDHRGLYEKYWFEKCDEMVDESWRSESIFSRDINYISKYNLYL